MKINDIIFRYSFPRNYPKDGICRIRTFVNSKFQLVVLITDLDTKNTSSSVTNSIEVICENLISKLVVPAKSIFIEHYEPSSIRDHSFDIVTVEKEKETIWDYISIEQAKLLLGCDDDELINLTFKNKTLIEEIDKIRTQIAPHIDLPRQVESDYYLRQMEIEENMISKAELLNVINTGASEQELQRLLKKDLSIFAEIYASPDDNYICFSEFPIEGGFVDFVLLTGTSRMDVFLIEVKGADAGVSITLMMAANSFPLNPRLSACFKIDEII